MFALTPRAGEGKLLATATAFGHLEGSTGRARAGQALDRMAVEPP
jgi:hypothetical protein